MLKESKGNMYPWVTHTHTHLGGQCPHKCSYCYVDNPRWGRPERYQGKLRLIEPEFNVRYGTGRTIFVENCNDLFAWEVPSSFIERIINHCQQFPDNVYVFQTKNPDRFFDFEYLVKAVFGTTIESNRDYPKVTTTAPPVLQRYEAMKKIPKTFKRFVTIEPVLDFDVDVLAGWIRDIRPDFLNLGADSKGHDLPEPTVEKIMKLVEKLKGYGIELREKHNLQRLKPS
jgi:DNA repair photolyase